MHPPSPTFEPEESKPETVEHTPTPWFVCTDPQNETWHAGRTIGTEERTGGRRVADPCLFDADEIAHANAAFIVRAVNNHDDLVAALEALIDVSSEAFASLDEEGLFNSEHEITIKAARAAVARAKAQPA